MRSLLRIALSSALAFAFFPTLMACGAGAEKNGAGGPLHDGGTVGDDATSGDGGNADDTGFVLGDSGGQADSAIDPDAACAAQSYDGVRIPPNILLVFDQSGSMSDCADPNQYSCPGADKWAAATSAVNQLMASAPKDLNVGIKFFGTVDDSCVDADYAKPDVPIGPLSSTQNPINCWLGKATCAGITAASPQTLTEMGPAMRGGIAYLKSLKTDGQRIAILITDGDPVGCSSNNDISDVIVAAANGFGGTPKVITYAIGVPGSTIENLSQVAAAGGGKRVPTCVANTTDATQACHYQIGTSNVQADLLKALNDITGKSLTCVFKVPMSTADGGVADPNQVNVNLTSGGSTSTLGKDPSHTNGWDYTDGGSTITLYGPPCQTVLNDGTAKVDILLGCPTKGPQ